MGSSILRAIATAGQGIAQGSVKAEAEKRRREEEDREYQRKIQHDAAAKALLDIQIKKANEPPPAPKPMRPEFILGPDGRVHGINPETGEVKDYGAIGKPTPPPAPPAPRAIDRYSPEGIKAQKELDEHRARLDTQYAKPSTAGQIPAETERRAAGLYTLAKKASEQIDALPAPGLWGETARKIPVIGNTIKGGQRQLIDQAAMQFGRAYLYALSGANAGDEEALAAGLTFVPEVGDTPETLTRKKQARQEALSAIERMGGRAIRPEDTAKPPVAGGALGGNSSRSTEKADRWQELRAKGLSPAAATAKVNQEFGTTP